MTRRSSIWGRSVGALLILTANGQASAGCTVSASGLAFGTYQPLTLPGKLSSADVTSSANVSVVCTGIVSGGAYNIALGPSAVGSGDRISTRYLTNSNGGDYMTFNVYREASYSTIWGDGMTGGNVIDGILPTGDSNQSHTVYGRIAAGQSTLKAGSFSGALIVTLTYSP